MEGWAIAQSPILGTTITLERLSKRGYISLLPQRFVRIRHYGIYNHTTKRSLELMFIPEKLNVEKLIKFKETSTERIKRLTGFDIGLCQCCKKGKMHIINIIPRNRDPPDHLPSIFISKLQ